MSKTYLSVQNIIMTKLDLAYNYAGMHDICYEPLALTASDSYVTWRLGIFDPWDWLLC